MYCRPQSEKDSILGEKLVNMPNNEPLQPSAFAIGYPRRAALKIRIFCPSRGMQIPPPGAKIRSPILSFTGWLAQR
jgi:hypothetical protein